MYRHWYVATLNQLSVDESIVFLSSLELLDNDSLSEELRGCAIKEIEQTFDLNLQIYSLPILLHVALSDTAATLQRQAAYLINTICKKTRNPEAIEFSQNLKNRETLTILLQNYKNDNTCPGKVTETEYIELISRTDQIMAFGIILELKAGEVSDLIEGDNNWTEQLRKAVNGEYGRYITTIAAEIINKHSFLFPEKSPDEFMPFDIRFYSQPDLLHAWIALKTAGLSAEECLDTRIPVWFPKAVNSSSLRDSASWLFRGRDNIDITRDEYVNSFFYIWEYSLWYFAVKRAIWEGSLSKITDRLIRFWKGNRDRNSERTPWVYRSYPQWNKQRSTPSKNPEYKIIKTQTGALKVSLAMPLMALMISKSSNVCEFLGDLSLNLYDVLAGPSVKSYVEKGFYRESGTDNVERKYSPAVISILAYADKLSSQIGKGYYNPTIPGLYARLIEKKAVPVFRGEKVHLSTQERYLHSGVSVLACSYLAYEEASGTIPVGQKKRIWMEGDNESLAARICKIALNEFCHFINDNACYKGAPYKILGKPVSLAYEHFPELLSGEVINNMHMRDWKEEWLQNNKDFKLRETELLLKTYPADEWKCTSIKLPGKGDEPYRFVLMALARKFTAILKNINANDEIEKNDYNQLEKWAENIAGLYKNIEFSRTSRFISIELLQALLTTEAFANVGCISEPIEPDARDISQVIIEAVMDLSRDAIFYQYAVGTVITESKMQQRETLKNLKCIYFSMLLGQLLAISDKNKLLYPFQIAERITTRDDRRYLLLWFIGRNREQIINDSQFRNKLVLLLNDIQYENYQKMTVTIRSNQIIADNTVLCDSKQWNNYWDPDTLLCANRVSSSIEITVPIEKREGEIIPVERDFLAFLLEYAYVQPTAVTLIESDENGILISAAPGFNYRLSAEFWGIDSYRILQEKIRTASEEYETNPCGLRINISIGDNNGIPVLELSDPETGFDTGNLEYRSVFQPGDSVSRQDLLDAKNRFSNINIGSLDYHEGIDHFCVADSGWDIICQRSGNVRFLPDRDWKSLGHVDSNEEAKFIKTLLGLHRGSLLKLNNIVACRGNEDNTQLLLAFTLHGIKLWVDSDSVSMDQYAISRNIQKPVVVLSVVPPLNNVTRPNGIIWQINYSLGKAAIKYLDGDNVRNIETDLTSLGVIGAYNGLPVSVTHNAVKCAQYLPRKNRARTMVARRLWKLKKVPGNAITGLNQLYLGECSLAEDDSLVYLVQDYNSGTLIAYDKPALKNMDHVCGVGEGPFKVSSINGYRSDNGTEIVVCRQGNRTYYGESEPGMFSSGGMLSDRVSIQLKEYHDDDTNMTLYDVRRIFSDPIPDTDESKKTIYSASAGIANQSVRLAQRYFDDYQAWIADPEWDYQIEGKLVNSSGIIMFRPERPLQYLPLDGDNPSEDNPRKWINRIPLSSDFEVPQRFMNKPAFCRIRWSNGPCANPNDTKSFDLAMFRKWLDLRYRGSKVYETCPLYFLKLQDTNMIFEWGLGYQLQIEPINFVIENQSRPENMLFYGDRIKRYEILKNGDRLLLHVMSVEDCDISFEHKIKQFSDKKGKPFLKVNYNKDNDKVSTQSIAIVGDQKKLEVNNLAWSFEPYHNGYLDTNAEKIVRDQLPDGGEGYILVKPEWDVSLLKMRYSITSAQKGDVLCLMGGDICQQAGGNDYYVPFNLPFPQNMILSDTATKTEIRVYRRNFSYRESILRTYFMQGNLSVFKRPMLVKIEEHNGGVFGSIKALPRRRIDYVKEWVKRAGPQNIVFGRPSSGNTVIVEIRPGILCSVQKGEGIPDEGGIGKLYLNDDILLVDTISDSDRRFCEPGRTVELLIKSRHALNDQNDMHFTVAGLPQIQISNQVLGKALARVNPPRYGTLVNDHEISAREDALSYGYLKVTVDEAGKRRLSLFRRKHDTPEKYVQFHRISFLDGNINELLNHIERGRWHYHDLTTFILRGGNEITYTYPQNADLPILFSDGWSLRYPKQELMKYAFPPHELEEFGVPEDQKELDNFYPVAGKDRNSIFVELMPGRIVKLPLKSLKIDFEYDADTVLRTNAFDVGDLIRLETKERETGKPLEISISDVRYGLRSLIQNDAFLKVQKWEFGCITLGCGAFNLRYISLIKKPSPLPSVMCLSSDNGLSHVQDTMYPDKGDIVSISLDQNKSLYAVGFEDTKVTLDKSGTRGWTNGEYWLKKSFNYPEFFDAMGGSIPMRVESSDIVKNELTVSYPQPGNPMSGEVLCAQFIARMGTSNQILLRAGSRLIMLNLSEQLHISGELTSVIMDKCIRKYFNCGKSLWLRYHTDDADYPGKYIIGIEQEKSSIFSVKPLVIVDSEYGRGYLCENVRTHEWIWLPIMNIARSKDATALSVMSVLQKYYCTDLNSKKSDYPVFAVGRDPVTKYASWHDANDKYKNSFASLTGGDAEKVINVRIIKKLAVKDSNVYLCHERPRGNIYQLRSEIDHSTTGVDSFVSAFCIEKDDTCAELVPVREYRTRLKFSHYMIETLRKGYENNDHMINNWTEIRSRYALEVTPEILCQCEKVNEFDRQNFSRNDPEYSALMNKFEESIIDMLALFGEVTDSDDISVCVAIAFAIFAFKKKPAVGEEIFKVIKSEAEFYCCEEILLRDWLLENEIHSRYDPRRILERVDVRGIDLRDGGINNTYAGYLLPDQISDIKQITDTILRRNRVNIKSEIYSLALSLRYAVEQKNNDRLNTAWDQCQYNFIRNNDSLKSLYYSKRFTEWYDDLRSKQHLRHIYVQNPKRIIELLQMVMEENR